MMCFYPTSIPDVLCIKFDLRGDKRGHFARRFCTREFAEAGLPTTFVQMNHSVTLGVGSARGMHYQRQPNAEDKLVCCTLGRVYDVALDLRTGSSTYLKWTAVELDEATALFIPKGCAHGFQSLMEETHLTYLHSAFYAPELEAGISADDPAVGIEWPLPFANRSQRDMDFKPLTSDFRGIVL